ncbi:anion permease [Epibacterium sp. MM17-32]|uniref:SLC13 family permease n=1 Tax=Epibacterium sp. MM17-32 TaxID=2917734 RepID=UPI001EF4EA8F|nr:SLC13 family permease [Epibacterium sp. MM17-32]MCG7630002.1 anion permease [Epibacterium sp. MM17-32]
MSKKAEQVSLSSASIPIGKPPLVLSATVWKILIIVMLGILAWTTAHRYLSPDLAPVAAIAVVCLGFWATAVMPEYWTALAFFLVAMVTQIAPPETVFSGFETSTFWLLFAGLVLGAAIKFTGLDTQVARLLTRLPFRTYTGTLAGIAAGSVALAFLVPSSIGRIMILLPVISALAAQLGFEARSNGRTGMLVAACFATFAPAFTILPANAPNMILVGMSEAQYRLEFSYFDYLLLHFPVLGLLKSGVIIGLTLVFFPDRLPNRTDLDAQEAEPVTREQGMLIAILALCLALWLADAWHGISPAWIGLAAALLCLWPSLRMTGPKCINQDLSYGALLFVAGIMGLGALIGHAGLGEALVQVSGDWINLSPDTPVWNLSVLTGMSTLVAMATSLPGVPAVMTPMAGDLASAAGLPVSTVLMTQVLAFSNVFLPFQAPPLVVAIQAGNLRAGAVIRFCLALFAISLCLLVPLDFLWWAVLGQI